MVQHIFFYSTKAIGIKIVFTIILGESNKFEVHLKESLLIKPDKPELNGNIYRYPLELFCFHNLYFKYLLR